MNKREDRNHKRDNSTHFKRALLTGFVGGLFWSLIGVIMYYFNFVEVTARTFILQSWTKAEWATGWIGNITSIFIVGIISIVAAIVYYILFKKFNSFWVGVLYGIGLWFIVYYFLNSLFNNVPSLNELSKESIVSSLSLYILYGTFIGYSISFDYNGSIEAVRKNK